MSWRPMSSWPATAAPARRAAHAVHGLARRGEFRAVAARARTRLHSGNWGGLLSNPPSCWRTPSPRWWTRAVASRARPASAAHPAGGGASPGRAGRGRRRGRSRHRRALGRARPVGLGKGVRLEQPGRADLRRRRSGQTGQRHPPEASAWCQLRFVVGTDWRALETHVREHLRQAGFDEVGIRLGAQAGATRLSPDNAWVRWAAASIERSTGKRPALLPNLGGSLPNDIFADLLGLPTIWVPHSYPACAQHAPTSTCWAASPARAWPSWPACSGTWATRDRPCATPPRPSTLTPRPRMSIKTRAAATALAAAAARRTPPTRTADQDRRALHAGRRDRFGGAPAGQQAGKLGQPVIIENRPGASTVIGAEAVAARPDGYADGVGQHHYSVLPALKTDLPYDPLRATNTSPSSRWRRWCCWRAGPARQHGRRSGRTGPQSGRAN